MAGKTLSTGTMSLRFMQNASRAKQLKEVQLDRAEVNDDADGRWELSKEIKESWDLTSQTESHDAVTHDSSYLPFLFSSATDGETGGSFGNAFNRPKGRRAFDKKGNEVDVEAPEPTPTEPVEAPTKGRKAHPNPISISQTSSSNHLRGFDEPSKLKDAKDSKTARQAIFESGGVGTDIRVQPSSDSKPSSTAKPLPAAFLKPSGVDDPSEMGKRDSEQSGTEVLVEGARTKKGKRGRESGLDQSKENGKKLKKKRKAAE